MKIARFQACNQGFSTLEIHPAQLNFSFSRTGFCYLYEELAEIQANFKNSSVKSKAVSSACFSLRQR